jgi:putative salt-induced outer membrane protein
MKKLVINAIAVLVLSGVISVSVAAEGWTGQGEAGLVKASGNTDNENANIGLGFTNQSDNWRHKLGFKYLTANSDGKDTAKSFSADYIAKRDLTERSHLFAGLNYVDDDFDGFTEQSSVSTGYGYHLIDTKQVGLELGIGVGYRDTSELTKQADGSELEGKDLGNATGVLLMNYRNKLTANTEFVDGFKAELGSKNSFIENDAALIVSMNEKFALKAGVLIRYNSDPPVGSDDTDTITTINLVYNFR